MATAFAPSAQDFSAYKPKGIFLHDALKPVEHCVRDALCFHSGFKSCDIKIALV